jgi:nitrate reductase gamma subunit
MSVIICLLGVILLLQKRIFQKRQKYEQALLLVNVLTGMGLCVIRIDCLSSLLEYELLLNLFFLRIIIHPGRVSESIAFVSATTTSALDARYYIRDITYMIS